MVSPAVFFTTGSQEITTLALMKRLLGRGYRVVTQVAKAGTFWPAGVFHQNYYKRTGKAPYCHKRVRRFGSARGA